VRSRLTAGLLAVLPCAGGCIGAPSVERAYEDRAIEGRYIGEAGYAAFLRGALAEASGDLSGALAGYEQAAAVDAGSPEIGTRIAAVKCAMNRNCASSPGDASTGVALVARALTALDRLTAWEDVAAWGEAHADAALWSHALVQVVRLDPSRRAAVVSTAARLAGAGHLAEGRAVAAAAVDASSEPLDGDREPLGARLAVDEALVRGDGTRARRRASAVRMPLEEVAARALLVGRPMLAQRIASDLVEAEPGGLGPRLVLAASENVDVMGASQLVDKGASGGVSGATLVAFGAVLVHSVPPEQARRTLSRIPHGTLVAGDDGVLRVAATLVSSGALDRAVLPDVPR
jgi:hypothetical protein